MPRKSGGDDRVLRLLKFREEHGHFLLPARTPWTELQAWAEHQRALWQAKQLDAATERALREIGFPFDQHELAWERSLAAAHAYRERHGALPHGEDTARARWLQGQRNLQKAGALDAIREERLDALGAFDGDG